MRIHRRKRYDLKVLFTSIVLVIAVTMDIGYSLLTQDLTISGTAVASKNTWDLHFVEGSIVEDASHLSACSNPNTCSLVNSSAEIQEDGISIDFGVTFHNIGDYYQFTVDVVNDGTIDAMLYDVVKEGLSNYSNYLDFDVTYYDGMPLLRYDKLAKCGGTEKLKVKVTFVNAPENDVPADLSLTVNYTQGDNNMALRAKDPETRIRALNTIGTSIADDDPDGNLRFIGANPNNYVWFNGQKWRIIGVFDGKLKIIEDPIGGYSFDTSRNTVNNGYGVNVWGPTTYTSDSSAYDGADLMKLLNPGYNNNTDLKCKTSVTITNGVANCGDNSDDAYNTGLVNNSLWWNGGSGYCYNYGNHQVTSCNFSSTGLKSDEARNMIASTRWYLGSNSTSINPYDGRMNASYLYGMERSNNPGNACTSGSYCTDGLNRITYWDGKVGLLYPSDFAYATGGGTIGREDCLSYNVGYNSDGSIANWTNTYTECKNDDWLLPASWSWSLSPRASSSYSTYVFYVSTSGYVNDYHALYAGSVRPAVFLKSSVAFTDEGNGTQSSPFVLKNTE